MERQVYGKLSVRTTSAGGSLPIPGSIVKIKGISDGIKEIQYSLITDVDGTTDKISLPTPLVIYSQTPNSKTLPYALYDIEVNAENFYTKHIYNVALFEGVDTFLPVNMIPLSLHVNEPPFPESGLDTYVKENEKL